MNILIGGTGFIGSALARELIKRNKEVISIARPGGGDIAGVEYISTHLESDPLPRPLVDRAENVFILIGQAGPSFDTEKEEKLLRRVVTPLVKGTQRVFFFSSVLVYGDTPKPADEQSPCRPVGEYPKFKLASEAILRDLIPPERLIIFRLGNVYGSPKNRGIIGLAMKKVVAPSDNAPLLLNGNGRMRRDYIFLDDVVGAVLAVAGQNDGVGTVNVATGRSVSSLDVVKIVSKVAAHTIPYQLVDNKPDEAGVVLVSNRHLVKDYGYQHFTGFEDGLRETLSRYGEGTEQ